MLNQGDCPVFQPVARRASLYVDSVKLEDGLEDKLGLECFPPSPSSSNGSAVASANFQSDQAAEQIVFSDTGVGPRRIKSLVSSMKNGPQREKRKRSRVTADQLSRLEVFFSEDRIPTATRRRYISQCLGMQERQTQIWFQNRRAKAKLLEKRGNREHPEPMEAIADPPPELRSARETDLLNLIHEDEPIIIISCRELTIGSWRRVANVEAKYDLVGYVSDSKRCLTWFVHSSGYSFKIEVPFDTIVDTQLANALCDTGMASFFLSKPPLFYTETTSCSSEDASAQRVWQTSDDWTAGTQASVVLRHDLIGSAAQLAHIMRRFPPSAADSEARLCSTVYYPNPQPSPSMDPPPFHSPLTPATSMSEESDNSMSVSERDHFAHKRSFSGSPVLTDMSYCQDSESPVLCVDPRICEVQTSLSATYASSPYSQPSGSSGFPTPLTPDYPLPTYFDYSGPEVEYCTSRPAFSSDGEYATVSPRVMSSGPYIADPQGSLTDGPSTFAMNEVVVRHSSLSNISALPTPIHTPSSALLTSPYRPECRVFTPDINMCLNDAQCNVFDIAETAPATLPDLGDSSYWGIDHMHYYDGQCA